MKKVSLITTLAVLVLVALMSVLPGSSAHAAEPAIINLIVRNSTGGTISMVLTDELGFHFTFTYAPGMTTSMLKEGKYTYYANTPCGAEAGSFNLNRSKKLDFFCSKEGREINIYNNYQVPQSCEMMMKAYHSELGWVYESNSFWYKIILEHSINQGSWECYDGVTPIIFTSSRTK